MSETDTPEVVPGPEGAPYHFVKCPILGRYRCSLLCRTICADQAWSDDRASKVRGDCDSWAKYIEIKSTLEEEE